MIKKTQIAKANKENKLNNRSSKNLTYKDSGVDIEVGDQFVELIKPIAKSTMRKEVLTGVGGFGALCEIPKKYNHPVLVSGTDGIGTKLKFALEVDKLETLGIDLVAMCANDVLTSGAQPLFFLDYYACGKITLTDGERLIRGVGEGCKQAGCALIGGETAEMPGLYEGRDFDMAGFVVGVVEKKKIITGKKINFGDVLIGIASSGVHSNGYSLVRKICNSVKNLSAQKISNKKVTDILITPTKIYVKTILALSEKIKIKGLAHITGGGLIGNVPRMFENNNNLIAEINTKNWQIPPVFNWLQKHGSVDNKEMFKVFNMGIGMVIVVSQKHVDETIAELIKLGEKAYVIGGVDKREKNETRECRIYY